MLNSLGDVEIIGETGDGREALELIQKHRPDVALLDITMPSLTGLEVAKRMANQIENVRVIILSMHTSEDYTARAVRAGVSGYLLKKRRSCRTGTGDPSGHERRNVLESRRFEAAR